VERINADANTRFGILVGSGATNVVRDCTVSATGGTTVGTDYTAGIWLESTTSLAEGNRVARTTAAAGGTVSYGLDLGADGRAVRNEVVGNGDANACFAFASGVIYKSNTASLCGVPYSGGTPIGTTNHP